MDKMRYTGLTQASKVQTVPLYPITQRPVSCFEEYGSGRCQLIKRKLRHALPVMLSLRGQSGLEAKIVASASASRCWPRPGLDLVVLLCNRVFFVQKSCIIRKVC